MLVGGYVVSNNSQNRHRYEDHDGFPRHLMTRPLATTNGADIIGLVKRGKVLRGCHARVTCRYRCGDVFIADVRSGCYEFIEIEMQLLTKKDLAEQIKCAPHTIDVWLKRGLGPPIIRVGGFIRFDPDDVAVWLADQKRTPMGAADV
jgi:MerR HTH family regulatory protein